MVATRSKSGKGASGASSSGSSTSGNNRGGGGNGGSLLQPTPTTPTTPTTPVEKNVKKTKGHQHQSLLSSTAATTSSNNNLNNGGRPDFYPPISMTSSTTTNERTPSVRFDLSAGSASSAFTAVEPRTTTLHNNNNSAMASFGTLSTLSGSSNNSISMNYNNTNTSVLSIDQERRTSEDYPKRTNTDKDDDDDDDDDDDGILLAAKGAPDEVLETTSSSFSGGKRENGESEEDDDDEEKYRWLPMTPTHHLRNSTSSSISKSRDQDNDHYADPVNEQILTVDQNKKEISEDYPGKADDDSQNFMTSPSKEGNRLMETPPGSPPTPLVRNTSARKLAISTNATSISPIDWLESEKEPFQLDRHKMPHSPPMSSRYLLNSGKTLPEFHSPVPVVPYVTDLNNNGILQPQPNKQDQGQEYSPPQQADQLSLHRETASSVSSKGQLSPPLSDLDLDESVVSVVLDDRRVEPPSPPLSPFDLEGAAAGFRIKKGGLKGRWGSLVVVGRGVNTTSTTTTTTPTETSDRRTQQQECDPESPPLSSLKFNCTDQMLESALSLPSLPIADGNADDSTNRTFMNDDAKHDSSKYEDDRSQGVVSMDYNIASEHSGEASPLPRTPSRPPRSPASPPKITRTAWLYNEKEPFEMDPEIQEEPLSPPISSSNLLAAKMCTVNDDDENCNHYIEDKSKNNRTARLVLSPPTSPPPPTLDMTKTLLEELNQSQELRHAGRNSDKKRSKQLDALRVVRVILKGSNYPPDKDITSAKACFEAIRQYAMLKIEASNLSAHLEDSKRQLKQLYLEWKELSDGMQGTISDRNTTKNSIPKYDRNHDSMTILQQLMSDDDSIYKEEDTTDDDNDNDQNSNFGDAVGVNEFSVSSHVDQETNPVKAINSLYKELGNEMNHIRTAWNDCQQQRQQQEQKSSILETEKRDQPDGNSSDSSLLEMERIVDDTEPAKDIGEDPLLESNDSFLLAKIEELTAQIESMEKDRVILTGYMDRLAQEVVKMDDTSFDSNEKADEVGNQESIPLNWTTFGKKFPIYQVKEDVEDTTANCGIEQCNLESKRKNKYIKSYRPPSLLYRARRFHASNDSDLMLPINLPGSRGVSFERRELQNNSDQDDEEEEDLHAQLEMKLAQLVYVSQSRDEDDDINSFGSLEKKVASISFESFFARRRLLANSSLEGNQKSDGKFLHKLKAKMASTTKETANLLDSEDKESPSGQDRILRSDDYAGSLAVVNPTTLLDPYSTFVSPRPASLDSNLMQKLRSPTLELELSLPRKAPSLVATHGQGEEQKIARPSSPNDEDGKKHQEGYVRLSSRLFQTQQELYRAQAHLSLLYKKQKLTTLELQKAHRELQKWKMLSISAPANRGRLSSLDYSTGSGEISVSQTSLQTSNHDLSELKRKTQMLIEKCQKEATARDPSDNAEEKKSWDALVAAGEEKLLAQASDNESMLEEIDDLQKELMQLRQAPDDQENTTGRSEKDIEIQLLEKSEECTRLGMQVQSLTEQLEQQMAIVAQLEGQMDLSTNDPSSLVVESIKRDRDENRDKMIRLSKELADSKAQIDQLRSIIKTKDLDSCSNSTGNSSNKSGTNSSASSSSKRTSGVAKAARASIRNLIFKRFPSGTKSKSAIENSKKTTSAVPYAAMKQEPEEDIAVGNPSEREGGDDIGSKIDAIFDASKGPAKIKVVTVDEDTSSSNNEYEDNNDDDIKSGSGASSSSMDGILVQFRCKTSMDASAREDTQFATIHAMTRRIEGLEEENKTLRSKLSATERRDD